LSAFGSYIAETFGKDIMRVFQLSGLILTAGVLSVGYWRPLRLARTVSPAATYTNPVIDRNFPDPSLLNDKGIFYAYATNSGPNMLCARSPDLVHWIDLPDAMPALPDWARPGRTWAPCVAARRLGAGYVAYFAAWNKTTGQENIGAAVASIPPGPFITPPHTKPLVEQAEEGGAIDPACFTDDDGTRYLIWKNDGNSRGRDTWLWLQKLSADGLSLLGTPRRLIKQDQSWEGSLIEAPTLWKHGGIYYLFYSANAYNTCRYAVGYAAAAAVNGPYVKPSDRPWLPGTPETCGPGGEDIFRAGDGSLWMAYHTWAHGPRTYRSMSIDALAWDKMGPHLLGPTHIPTAAPRGQAAPVWRAESVLSTRPAAPPPLRPTQPKFSMRTRKHTHAR